MNVWSWTWTHNIVYLNTQLTSCLHWREKKCLNFQFFSTAFDCRRLLLYLHKQHRPTMRFDFKWLSNYFPCAILTFYLLLLLLLLNKNVVKVKNSKFWMRIEDGSKTNPIKHFIQMHFLFENAIQKWHTKKPCGQSIWNLSTPVCPLSSRFYLFIHL